MKIEPTAKHALPTLPKNLFDLESSCFNNSAGKFRDMSTPINQRRNWYYMANCEEEANSFFCAVAGSV